MWVVKKLHGKPYPKFRFKLPCLFTFFLAFVFSSAQADEQAKDLFEKALEEPWKEVFFDSGTEDWESNWFLDGEIAAVENTPSGMTFSAGPKFREDAHHGVLWTKEIFEGDIKIDYTFTRTDFAERAVVILFIQASGEDHSPEREDISTWAEERKVPSMRKYYNGMHLYHISYTAFGLSFGDEQYLRARRYLPGSGKLRGSELPGDHFPEGLFAPGVPHRITVIKRGGREILMRVSSPDTTEYYRWFNEGLPPVEAGRVGLRHMFTRSGLYSDFSISVAEEEGSL